jgi:hypothetical protein
VPYALRSTLKAPRPVPVNVALTSPPPTGPQGSVLVIDHVCFIEPATDHLKRAITVLPPEASAGVATPKATTAVTPMRASR